MNRCLSIAGVLEVRRLFMSIEQRDPCFVVRWDVAQSQPQSRENRPTERQCGGLARCAGATGGHFCLRKWWDLIRSGKYLRLCFVALLHVS